MVFHLRLVVVKRARVREPQEASINAPPPPAPEGPLGEEDEEEHEAKN